MPDIRIAQAEDPESYADLKRSQYKRPIRLSEILLHNRPAAAPTATRFCGIYEDQRLRLAIDGMTDIREEAHHYSISNVSPRVGETGSIEEIISLVERLLEERNTAS